MGILFWWIKVIHKVLLRKKFWRAPTPATHRFWGSKFQKWAQIENFWFKMGARGMLAPKKNFFCGSEIKNLTLYKKIWGVWSDSTLHRCDFVPKSGKWPFLKNSIFWKKFICGLGCGRSGQKFWQKKLGTLCYLSKKKSPM